MSQTTYSRFGPKHELPRPQNSVANISIPKFVFYELNISRFLSSTPEQPTGCDEPFDDFVDVVDRVDSVAAKLTSTLVSAVSAKVTILLAFSAVVAVFTDLIPINQSNSQTENFTDFGTKKQT